MLCLLLPILIAIPTHAAILPEALNVNPPALPGDSERHLLAVPGVRLHEANDFIGNTDKHVTETGALSVMATWDDHYSSTLSYKGRYLIPALRTSHDEDKSENPVGAHAEWVEAAFHQSITLYTDKTWALKLDGGVGYNDMGDHNFADLYRDVHKETGDRDESGEFGEKLDENFLAVTSGASVVVPLGDFNLIGGYQGMNSAAFREDAVEGALVWRISEGFGLTAKYASVRQKRSDFLDLKKHRAQAVAALRLFTIWTPSIMWVSPYIKGDPHGQWYVSPLSLTWPF